MSAPSGTVAGPNDGAPPAPAPSGGGLPAPPRRRTALLAAGGVGVVLVLLVAVLATRDYSGTRTADSPLLGRPAPAVEGPSLLDGESFDLADQRGRWVLVNFFATWCVPCQAEHPELVRFDAAHAGAGDARVISVVFSDDADDVRRFFEQRGGKWPVIDDPVGRVALEWGVTGVPESFLVGPDGTVQAKVVGGIRFDSLEDLLAQAQGVAHGGDAGGAAPQGERP
ncbi:MAG: redoxin family protein [Proteobacteria bacterium]|nr:redoxin family protein [Pseudomonadota bacterium]